MSKTLLIFDEGTSDPKTYAVLAAGLIDPRVSGCILNSDNEQDYDEKTWDLVREYAHYLGIEEGTEFPKAFGMWREHLINNPQEITVSEIVYIGWWE